MKKLIIFDYDGVIIDSFPAVHKIFQKICKKLGKSCPESIEEFQKTYGQNYIECCQNIGFTKEDFSVARDLFKKSTGRNAQLFEGSIETIKELDKLYNMAIISSCPDIVVKKELEQFGLLEYFKEIIGGTTLKTNQSPKAEAIKSIVEKYSTPENTISIGDRNIDFTEGTAAGLKNILLVDYGWGYDTKLIPEYKQNFTIKNPLELIDAINNILNHA